MIAYNVTGQWIAVLASGCHPSGTYKFTLDGSSLASGRYFIRVTVSGKQDEVQKVMLVR